ncbi:MAG TPA: hypothetical protein PKC67_00105 [Kiritimatiellia bacterium]|nr:hypothetical protein [Kiritimatiellia bacterium]HMP32722.1 hypothetical protein [Kiritimatiellia bacterium]
MNRWIVTVCLVCGWMMHSARAEEPVVTETEIGLAEVVEVGLLPEQVEQAAPAEQSPETIIDETPATDADPEAVEASKPPTFAVILPERIDHDWYWFLYTDTAQHIVQSAVEKALIRAGVEVIDLNTATLPSFGNNWERLVSNAFALEAGKQLKADYVVTGQATAVKASQGVAYGVTVYRSQAEITAKIVRVSDGKIIAIEDASIQEGGQSAQAAGQAALKKASGQIGGKIARAARGIVNDDAAPQ